MVGIRQAKPHKVFLGKVFGTPGKEEEVVDSEREKEVKEHLCVVKKVLDKKEKEIPTAVFKIPGQKRNDCQNKNFECKKKGWNAH